MQKATFEPPAEEVVMRLLDAIRSFTTAYLPIVEGTIYVGPGRNDNTPLEVALLPDAAAEQTFMQDLLTAMYRKGKGPEVYLDGVGIAVVLELQHPASELCRKLSTILNGHRRGNVSPTKIVVTVEATIGPQAAHFFATQFPEANACVLSVISDPNGAPPLWRGVVPRYTRGSPFAA